MCVCVCVCTCIRYIVLHFLTLQGNFFKNIGSIAVFAVVGTAISTLIVGGGLFALSKVGSLVIPPYFVL